MNPAGNATPERSGRSGSGEKWAYRSGVIGSILLLSVAAAALATAHWRSTLYVDADISAGSIDVSIPASLLFEFGCSEDPDECLPGAVTHQVTYTSGGTVPAAGFFGLTSGVAVPSCDLFTISIDDLTHPGKNLFTGDLCTLLTPGFVVELTQFDHQLDPADGLTVGITVTPNPPDPHDDAWPCGETLELTATTQWGQWNDPTHGLEGWWESDGGVDFDIALHPTQLRIVKVTEPSADSSTQFDFDLFDSTATKIADPSVVGNGGEYRSGVLLPGKYSLVEEALAGWDLKSATCDHGETIGDLDIGVGEVVTCTFTNTQRGHIVIDKVTSPAGDPQHFEFDVSWSGTNLLLADADTPVDTEVVPGPYTVSEVVPAGWDLATATCDQGETIDSLDVGPGETVTCTFTNTKRGHIVIDKVTNPTGDPQQFEFDVSWSGTNLLLADADTPADTEVVPGPYTVSEVVPAGWDLATATCDQGETIDSLDVEPGETITCTFNNTKLGRIVVNKVAHPAEAQEFSFTASWGAVAASHGSPYDSGWTLTPGSGFSLVEDGETGWIKGLASCSGSVQGAVGTLTNFTLNPGEQITCSFENWKAGRITIDKETLPDGDPTVFSFDASWGTGVTAGDGTDYDSGSVLSPGAGFSLSEIVPDGWSQTSASCTGSVQGAVSNLASFTVNPGEWIQCTFNNTELGHILVDKDANPDGDPQVFTFHPSWESEFTLTDAATPHDSGGLLPGGYSVTETLPSGWEQTSAVCTTGSGAMPATDITLGAGETVTCTFVNTKQAGTIVVQKVALPVGAPSQVFSFDASWDPGPSPDFTLTGTSSTQFSGLADGVYSVSEATASLPLEWGLSSELCESSLSPGVPFAPSNFHLGAGETVTCTFTNVYASLAGTCVHNSGTVKWSLEIVWTGFGTGDYYFANLKPAAEHLLTVSLESAPGGPPPPTPNPTGAWQAWPPFTDPMNPFDHEAGTVPYFAPWVKVSWKDNHKNGEFGTDYCYFPLPSP